MKYQLKQPHTNIQKIVPGFITALSCLAIGGLVLHGPISQDPSYHEFADFRTLLNVPNFWNVVSNFPFVLVGVFGLYKCKAIQNYSVEAENRISYTLFFTGVLFAGLSSAYNGSKYLLELCIKFKGISRVQQLTNIIESDLLICYACGMLKLRTGFLKRLVLRNFHNKKQHNLFRL